MRLTIRPIVQSRLTASLGLNSILVEAQLPGDAYQLNGSSIWVSNLDRQAQMVYFLGLLYVFSVLLTSHALLFERHLG